MLGLTRMGREAQGYAWASHQAGDVPPNPFASKLARDVENRKKHRVALGFQAGRCCEKASASPLTSVFCKTAPAFAQRIKPVIFGLPIRVYLGNPWLERLLPIRVN